MIIEMYRLKKWSITDLKENNVYVALCIDFFFSDNEISEFNKVSYWLKLIKVLKKTHQTWSNFFESSSNELENFLLYLFR